MPKSIAILAPSSVPFQVGGSEKFWWGLRDALGAWSNAFAELIKIPCPEATWDDLVSSYEKFSRLNLDHFDMIITTKYPAWMVAHPNHVCYMQHTLRELYDTYMPGLPKMLVNPPATLRDLLTLIRKPDPKRADLEPAFELCKKARATKSLPSSMFTFPGPLIREVVHFFDRVALARDEIKAWLAISRTVAEREDYLPERVPVKILPHPSDLRSFQCREGKYLFTASRLNHTKRVRLLIDAMAHVSCDIPLKIAGTGPDADFLKECAANDPRIQFLGHVPDSELTDLYADSLAVLFAPHEEDYGLITIEAMKSGKPVITASDSGGVCEFVRNGETGLVVEPEASSLGAAISRLAQDPELARRMGETARKSVEFINWRNNVEELLKYAEAQNRPVGIATVLVAAPFAADANGAGAPRRLYHFCAELAKSFNTELVCLGSQTQKFVQRCQIAPNLFETSVPWGDDALAEAEAFARATGGSSDDIALMRHAVGNKSLNAELRKIGANAFCVVLSQPWLLDAVEAALPDTPLVYDAPNVESELKSAIFGEMEIARQTEDLEARICRKAKIIFAGSQADLTSFKEKFAVADERMRLLPIGFDASAPIREKTELRKRLPYPRARLALFIGSGHKPDLDAALAIIKIAAQVPDIEFLLAGSVSSRTLIRSAKCPENVHLLGIISEKTKNLLLAVCDLGLNPVASGSGVNLKTVEYLGSGLPCISTAVGMRGLPENLDPAITIAPLDAFPERICAFFANPPKAEALAEIARRFRKEYDWSNALKILIPELDALRVDEECHAAPD